MFSTELPIIHRAYRPQNTASWLIIDTNETPGGLASTDVTKEGFVSQRAGPCRKNTADQYLSSTTSVDTLSSPTTNTSMTALTRHCQKRMIGIHISAFRMCGIRVTGCPIHSKTTSPCYPRRTKSYVLMASSMPPLKPESQTRNLRISTNGLSEIWELESQTFSCDRTTSRSGLSLLPR